MEAIPIILTETTHPNRMLLADLETSFIQAGLRVQCAEDGVAAAVEKAKDMVGSQGIVIATGSMFVAADAISAWRGRPA